MIALFGPLLAASSRVVGAVMGSVADPNSERGLMVVGVTIVATMAIWAIGGLAAAVWTQIEAWAERRQSARRDRDKPMRS